MLVTFRLTNRTPRSSICWDLCSLLLGLEVLPGIGSWATSETWYPTPVVVVRLHCIILINCVSKWNKMLSTYEQFEQDPNWNMLQGHISYVICSRVGCFHPLTNALSDQVIVQKLALHLMAHWLRGRDKLATYPPVRSTHHHTNKAMSWLCTTKTSGIGPGLGYWVPGPKIMDQFQP